MRTVPALASPFVPVFGPGWDVSHALASRRARDGAPTTTRLHDRAVKSGEGQPEEGIGEFFATFLAAAFGFHLVSEVLHAKSLIDGMSSARSVQWMPVRTLDVRALLHPAWYYRPEAMPDTPRAVKVHTIHTNLSAPPPPSRSYGSFGTKGRM
jgi:hypothetical protein